MRSFDRSSWAASSSGLIVVAVLLCATGCATPLVEIPIVHGPLSSTSTFSGSLGVVSVASDLRADKTKIGQATATLFAIPAGKILSRTPIGDAVAMSVG